MASSFVRKEASSKRSVGLSTFETDNHRIMKQEVEVDTMARIISLNYLFQAKRAFALSQTTTDNQK